ncbi:hypothetical protein ACFL02_07455 [Planctomycetota bacterium]
MDAIFQRFRRQEGRFGTGRQLCLGLTWGKFWTLRHGCSNLYRGQGHIDNIDFEHILIVSDSKAKLDLGGDLTHEPDTDYFYAVRRVSGTGKQEQGTQAIVKLSLDENGQRRRSRPNYIRDLRAQPAAEGRIRLCWWYWPLGQQTEPDYFAVYGDGGSGNINYDQALAKVDYGRGNFYSYLSTPGIDGQTYRFSVRSVAKDEYDDGNRFFVETTVDLNGPASLEGVRGNTGF